MTRYLLAASLAAFVVVLGAAELTHLARMSTTLVAVDSATSEPSSATSSQTQNTGATPQSGYTLADVAKHNSQSSCWAAINGSVYDLTSWINQHPGGPERILAICGTDGSAAFNQQHGGQSEPAAELATFRIGSLTQ